MADSPEIDKKPSFAVEGPVSPSRLAELGIDAGIKNFRPAEAQKKALVQIASDDACKVFIAVNNETIIGYVAFHRPHELTRWSSLPFVLELGAIEISPGWRSRGVARALVRAAESHGFMENHVVTSLEYAWHWDLAGTGLDIWSYQKMLSGLFSAVGFEIYRTDDPDILEHPASIFMARIGKNITGEQRRAFLSLLFLNEKRY
ncbi:MAG: GNAT family N-acetyltransferase [Peptococcaceae bacterium]|nr:GNAT family N-acetyltransferase [Peptococcaceae bacterium]